LIINFKGLYPFRRKAAKQNGRKIHNDGELISTFLKGSTHLERKVKSKELGVRRDDAEGRRREDYHENTKERSHEKEQWRLGARFRSLATPDAGDAVAAERRKELKDSLQRTEDRNRFLQDRII
jgi:hypothetical protein